MLPERRIRWNMISYSLRLYILILHHTHFYEQDDTPFIKVSGKDGIVIRFKFKIGEHASLITITFWLQTSILYIRLFLRITPVSCVVIILKIFQNKLKQMLQYSINVAKVVNYQRQQKQKTNQFLKS